jgi:hypothetical protein
MNVKSNKMLNYGTLIGYSTVIPLSLAVTVER